LPPRRAHSPEPPAPPKGVPPLTHRVVERDRTTGLITRVREERPD